jgi:hypothetical protein
MQLTCNVICLLLQVYLRLPEGAGLDDIPPDTLEDCAQLVKQNSIQGG